MKLVVLCISITIFSSWVILSWVLLGHADISWLTLSLPKTTSEFGDSVGILNGLFSAFAVVLALVAVLLQGRELKASTKAQNEQADALKAQLENQEKVNDEQLRRSHTMVEQLQQQQIANRAIILQAQQQYHSAEIVRMDAILEKLDGRRDKEDVFNRCLAKKNDHIADLKAVHKEIKAIQ
jgi:hypothetical protein